MAGESTTVKELHLGFKGSDGKTKRIVITHPEENLDEAATRAAMKKIADANLFEKQGVQLYNGSESAAYLTRTKTPVFNDKKAK